MKTQPENVPIAEAKIGLKHTSTSVEIPPVAKKRRNKSTSKSSNDMSEISKPRESNTSPVSTGTSSVMNGRGIVIGVTRSISACQRCRSRKTRCDQTFPSCTSCLKAGVECVGIDAATGREIPRSYVSHLEDRVAFLEKELLSNGIEYEDKPKDYAAKFKIPEKSDNDDSAGTEDTDPVTAASASKVTNLMTSVRMVNDRGSKQQKSFLGQSSGLSFARMLYTAVKRRNPDSTANNLKAAASLSAKPSAELHFKVKPAKLPSKDIAEQFLADYFSQANSQLPILHREDFVKTIFEPIYGKLSTKVSLASDYTTMGVELSSGTDQKCYYYRNVQNQEQDDNKSEPPNPCLYFLYMIFGIATSIHQQQYPAHISESYRLAAAPHFDAVFSAPNRLESLQGILLLALYSIMRPAVPGVWYVLGSALRLCVDLGLHYEGGLKSWSNSHNIGESMHLTAEFDPVTVDLRRRLFWCTYALDRQVCVYLGRPFGIPEESVKVPFPSELDDTLISTESQQTVCDFSKETSNLPSYKTVSLSFLKIRLIQAEIQMILYDSADLPRRYKSLDEWKQTMARKLEDWHSQCPKSNKKMNCSFNLGFFELNYHQTRLLLHGISPLIIEPTVESYLIIADAGEKVIKKYHELHRKRNINYTWVAVHNLFMAGTSYLYALYHSAEVRAGTTLDEIDFNTLACIHVLSAMTDRCDAAAACRDSFELLTAAIMKLCYNEKAGIVMQLPGKGSTENINQQEEPHKGATETSNNMALDNIGDAGIMPSQSVLQWPVSDDLELFFQEAAQLEGISPDSIKMGSPEASVWLNNNSNSDKAQSPVGTNGFNYSTSQNFQSQGNGSRSEHQRIYDLMNELPLAPIWDQFFAPHATPGNINDQNDNGRQLNPPSACNSPAPLDILTTPRW